MSKRGQQPMIEDFDDDTDIPLPSHPLLNTGAKGALIQSVDTDSDGDEHSEDDDDDGEQRPVNRGAASPSQFPPPGFGSFTPPPGAGAGNQGPMRGTVTDLTPYKKYARPAILPHSRTRRPLKE